MRRVVVTGIGLVTPVGCGKDIAWKNLLAGHNGAKKITKFDASDLACKVAAFVPRVDDEDAPSEGAFDPDATMAARDRKRIDDFILYGIAAADEAIKDSGWMPGEDDVEARHRTGVMIGSGIGGLQTTYDASITLAEKGPRRLSPFVIPGMLINLASGQVSMRYGFQGPNHSVVTACASGVHAIGDAAFVACRAMTTGYNDEPTKASRPYDDGRDGFLMGEGAGIVVLEEYEHAKARGAHIYAEYKGYGLSGDAHHITSPPPDGNGGYRAMSAAINDAGIDITEIGYVNAHGTSTPVGDEIEVKAVERRFGDHAKNLLMSSTKSATGHLLGAAGAIEAIFSILALRDQIAPATLNLENCSIDTAIDLVALKPKPFKGSAVLSNSFGFGGTNAAIIFSKPE